MNCSTKNEINFYKQINYKPKKKNRNEQPLNVTIDFILIEK